MSLSQVALSGPHLCRRDNHGCLPYRAVTQMIFFLKNPHVYDVPGKYNGNANYSFYCFFFKYQLKDDLIDQAVDWGGGGFFHINTYKICR